MENENSPVDSLETDEVGSASDYPASVAEAKNLVTFDMRTLSAAKVLARNQFQNPQVMVAIIVQLKAYDSEDLSRYLAFLSQEKLITTELRQYLQSVFLLRERTQK